MDLDAYAYDKQRSADRNAPHLDVAITAIRFRDER